MYELERLVEQLENKIRELEENQIKGRCKDCLFFELTNNGSKYCDEDIRKCHDLEENEVTDMHYCGYFEVRNQKKPNP